MTSVIHRNRLSWHSSAEDCSGTSRFICLQLGDHKTEGASRLLIFCFFPNPVACKDLASLAGWITWMKRQAISRKDARRRVPTTVGAQDRPVGLASPSSARPCVPPKSLFFLHFLAMGSGVLTSVRAATAASGMTWK